eukprot:6206245-Pleurochrysis_carterae.AAC.1
MSADIERSYRHNRSCARMGERKDRMTPDAATAPKASVQMLRGPCGPSQSLTCCECTQGLCPFSLVTISMHASELGPAPLSP